MGVNKSHSTVKCLYISSHKFFSHETKSVWKIPVPWYTSIISICKINNMTSYEIWFKVGEINNVTSYEIWLKVGEIKCITETTMKSLTYWGTSLMLVGDDPITINILSAISIILFYIATDEFPKITNDLHLPNYFLNQQTDQHIYIIIPTTQNHNSGIYLMVRH